MGSTTYIVLKELAGNPPPHLNAIQHLLEPHVPLLVDCWKAAWLMTAAILVIVLLRSYKNTR